MLPKHSAATVPMNFERWVYSVSVNITDCALDFAYAWRPPVVWRQVRTKSRFFDGIFLRVNGNLAIAMLAGVAGLDIVRCRDDFLAWLRH